MPAFTSIATGLGAAAALGSMGSQMAGLGQPGAGPGAGGTSSGGANPMPAPAEQQPIMTPTQAAPPPPVETPPPAPVQSAPMPQQVPQQAPTQPPPPPAGFAVPGGAVPSVEEQPMDQAEFDSYMQPQAQAPQGPPPGIGEVIGEQPPADGDIGLMGTLGIVNMGAGIGNQIYNALKPKPKRPGRGGRSGGYRNPFNTRF